jgi:zinc transport system substrate-binding protein
VKVNKLQVIFIVFLLLLVVLPVQLYAGEKLTIYTVNYPLAYFAESIGKEHVMVEFPLPPSVDPAFWEPDENIVRKFQKADLIVLNGAGYAKWTSKVSLPMLRIVDTSRPFKNELIHIKTTVTHSHGPKGDHSHGGNAFTTWLDFSQAAMQAETICQALVRKMPAQKDYFARNFAALQDELLKLDKQMMKIGDNLNGTPLLASHPIYQYFARRYDMNIKMMMWEPDTDPGPAEWEKLQESLTDHPAKVILWEDVPLEDTVSKLERYGLRSLVFSPCPNLPEQGDFLNVMQRNVNNLAMAFQ